MSRRRARHLPLLLLLAPVAARAGSLSLPCNIPARADLVMTDEQSGWSGEGRPWTVRVVQRLHFARDAGGTRLTLDPASATSDLDAAGQQRLAAVYPPARPPIVLRLDAAGGIIGMDDLATHWRAYVARMEQVAHDLEAAGKPSARARAALAAMAQVDEPTRIAMIASAAAPLLRHCGQTVSAVPRDGAAVISAQSDTAQLSETARYEVDALTGLTRSAELRTLVKAQPERPQVERWRFDPAR